MKSNLTRYASLIGRVMLSLIFITSGFSKITGWQGTSAYMTSKGMFAVPFFLLMAILFELAGGFSVLLGYKARMGAVLLVIFLIPSSIIFHNFWAFEGMEQQLQMISFMKNVAVMGGLLMVFSLGPGGLSFDNKGQ